MGNVLKRVTETMWVLESLPRWSCLGTDTWKPYQRWT